MVSSFLLKTTADWLYQLNPTLCQEPPRADRDNEYCYCGVGPDHGGGGTRVTDDGAIVCQDISYS